MAGVARSSRPLTSVVCFAIRALIPKCYIISGILVIEVAHSRGKENGTQANKTAKIIPTTYRNQRSALSSRFFFLAPYIFHDFFCNSVNQFQLLPCRALQFSDSVLNILRVKLCYALIEQSLLFGFSG